MITGDAGLAQAAGPQTAPTISGAIARIDAIDITLKQQLGKLEGMLNDMVRGPEIAEPSAPESETPSLPSLPDLHSRIASIETTTNNISSRVAELQDLM